jgi:two-component system, cell cycle response regulator DivK
MRILIAEDQVDNREILARRLERKGHELFLAENGAEAVELAPKVMPDLVLMDVSMPIMSGVEATRILKQTPETAHIPVIVLTAHALPQVRADCEAAGCDGFSTKPIDFPALLTAIDAVMARRSAA